MLNGTITEIVAVGLWPQGAVARFRTTGTGKEPTAGTGSTAGSCVVLHVYSALAAQPTFRRIGYPLTFTLLPSPEDGLAGTFLPR